METKLWEMPETEPNLEKLNEAAKLLKAGELIAFPTETVYGLGANALDEKAVRKIYLAKGRPSDNPLIVHVCSMEDVEELVREIPPKARTLMENFWPGPLTLVLPKAKKIPEIITAGLDTVAIRMPAHLVALKLIELAQCPVAAPSANISGKPSPTTAQHVWQDLNGKIAGIVDGGRADIGVESTVLDVTLEVPTILRPGGITREQLIKVIGKVNLDTALFNVEAVPRSPGMKYTHYSPEADVVIFKGNTSETVTKIMKVLENPNEQKIGLMVSQEIFQNLPKKLSKNIVIKVLGSQGDLETITANLFDALRWFDQKGVSIIYAESFPESHIGAALMNRLIKAAGGKMQ
ncbi:MAG: L-threonylcarbamoyladenylate synthase [Peptococcales bacterium]